MGYILSVLASILLFIGFLALTEFEKRRGARLFALRRAALDAEVSRVSFVVTHVDFPAYLRDSLRALIARLMHDIAHGSLMAIRFIERMLTRAVRALRARTGANLPPPGIPTDFVASLKDFKQELRSNREAEEPD